MSVNIVTYAQAAFDRDTAIEEAQAEFDRATGDPRGVRIAEIEKAKADYDKIDIPAQRALDDPFIEPNREMIVDGTS